MTTDTTIAATVKAPAHTALPLPFMEDPLRLGVLGDISTVDGSECIAQVQQVAGDDRVQSTRQQRTAFIIRACNSHYALLEALREWDAIMNAGLFNVDPDRIDRAREMQHAAIIQAIGEV